MWTPFYLFRSFRLVTVCCEFAEGYGAADKLKFSYFVGTHCACCRRFTSVVDMIWFCRKSKLRNGRKKLFWCLNLHKKFKTMLFLAKQCSKTVYCPLKWPICAISALGNYRFSRFPPKKFYKKNYWSEQSFNCRFLLFLNLMAILSGI